MARKDKLNCLAKRDLLNRTVASVEALLSWGEYYESAGLLHDAVDFYEKAKAKERLFGLLEVVREEGDAFLFKRIHRILGIEPSREEWLHLCERAEKLGKERFAKMGYEALGIDASAADESVLH